jgi:hypothetical protein
MHNEVNVFLPSELQKAWSENSRKAALEARRRKKGASSSTAAGSSSNKQSSPDLTKDPRFRQHMSNLDPYERAQVHSAIKSGFKPTEKHLNKTGFGNPLYGGALTHIDKQEAAKKKATREQGGLPQNLSRGVAARYLDERKGASSAKDRAGIRGDYQADHDWSHRDVADIHRWDKAGRK